MNAKRLSVVINSRNSTRGRTETPTQSPNWPPTPKINASILKKESKDIQISKTCWQRGEQLQSIEHGGYKHESHSVKIAISYSQRNLPSHKESLVRKTLSLSICAPAYPYRVFFLRRWDDASIILYYFPVPSKRLKQL